MTISICIPTYNRLSELKELVDSLLEHDVYEIAISDNGSTDGTKEYLDLLKLQNKNVKVDRFPHNVGPDRNFVNAVEISSGEFCWLMGSDDGIDFDHYEELSESLAYFSPDVALLSLKECDSKMNVMSEHLWSNRNITLVDFKNEEKVDQFFFQFQPLWGLMFGYISSIIFKRESWNSIKLPDDYLDSFYSFTYIVYRLLDKGGSLLDFSKTIVLNRGYNDSMVTEFQGNAVFKRLMLDVNAYVMFGKEVGGCITKEHLNRVAQNNFTWYPLLKLRISSQKQVWDEEVRFVLLNKLGISPRLVKVIGFLGFFSRFFRGLLALKNRFYSGRRIFNKKLI